MNLTLTQAQEISRLSNVKTDECTLVPEFGIGKGCIMHDHLLIYFVWFTHRLNAEQRRYMEAGGLHNLIAWSDTDGYSGEPFSWKMANSMFRRYLDKHVKSSGTIWRKAFYYFIRVTYYYGVTIWHRLRR